MTFTLAMTSQLLTSTAFLPPVSWYLAALGHGEWKIEAHENFQKGGFRNRCKLATANGPRWLSIPLEKGKHQATAIQEVKISYQTDWARQHEQTIRSAYGRAPFFEYYSDAVFARLHTQTRLLWSFNQSLLDLLQTYLQLPVIPAQTEGFMAMEGSSNCLDARHLRTELPVTAPPYPQLFADRHGFQNDLSILDLLFCLGPAAGSYLRNNAKQPLL